VRRPPAERDVGRVDGRLDPRTGGGRDELTVREQAPIAGKTLQAANEEGLVPSDVLVVRINRDEGAITPTGETVIKEGDFVTIHSRSGVTEDTLDVFTGR